MSATSFSQALSENNPKTAISLLQKGVNDDELIIACCLGCYEAVVILVKHNPVRLIDPSIKDNLAIITAVKNKHFKIVNFLIEDRRVDPSVMNNYVLLTLIKSEELELIKKLALHTKIVIDCNYIITACENKQFDVAELLLQYYIKDNNSSSYNYILKGASQYGAINIVKILLKNEKLQEDISICNTCDNSKYAITIACENGHVEIVKILFKHSPKNVLSDVLYKAIEKNHIEIVEFLLEKKVKLKYYIYNNDIIMKEIGCNNYYDLLKILLKYIEISKISTDLNICTLVHYAYLYKNYEMLRLLSSNITTNYYVMRDNYIVKASKTEGFDNVHDYIINEIMKEYVKN